MQSSSFSLPLEAELCERDRSRLLGRESLSRNLVRTWRRCSSMWRYLQRGTVCSSSHIVLPLLRAPGLLRAFKPNALSGCRCNDEAICRQTRTRLDVILNGERREKIMAESRSRTENVRGFKTARGNEIAGRDLIENTLYPCSLFLFLSLRHSASDHDE